jgi:hypothetical protein
LHNVNYEWLGKAGTWSLKWKYRNHRPVFCMFFLRSLMSGSYGCESGKE